MCHPVIVRLIHKHDKVSSRQTKSSKRSVGGWRVFAPAAAGGAPPGAGLAVRVAGDPGGGHQAGRGQGGGPAPPAASRRAVERFWIQRLYFTYIVSVYKDF